MCSLFQVSERMKIVDVIGEKVYKDGERIITQVSGDLRQLLSRKSPPEGLVRRLSTHPGELMLLSTQAHFLQNLLKPIDVHLWPLFTFPCLLVLFFWISFTFHPEYASFITVKTWRSAGCVFSLSVWPKVSLS